MTSIDTWPLWVVIIVTGGPGLLEILSIAYSLYLCRRHLDAIKDALKNSRYMYLWGPSLGRRGLIWSLLEIIKLTQMIMMPRASLAIGELDPVDLENFPAYLKRLLKIKLVMLLSCAAWFVIAAALVKFK
ncbi:hypothetical protein RGV33_10605 [Pseudomonas sp. Bout1]|uniref:hypothetical protein n=1 Tax=Pseudomonas sp. Bout1 TaxID=3048600 RepID=UPI002AB5D437|nr:hypothetical protein [Pseudomonas sp. Bout1]MDY7532132.1 hypothetical protein [Pseudomonas sp. Bout1]MEB0189107.1 hypothetical protein [Pseudomonas sp. Bout1]